MCFVPFFACELCAHVIYGPGEPCKHRIYTFGELLMENPAAVEEPLDACSYFDVQLQETLSIGYCTSPKCPSHQLQAAGQILEDAFQEINQFALTKVEEQIAIYNQAIADYLKAHEPSFIEKCKSDVLVRLGGQFPPRGRTHRLGGYQMERSVARPRLPVTRIPLSFDDDDDDDTGSAVELDSGSDSGNAQPQFQKGYPGYRLSPEEKRANARLIAAEKAGHVAPKPSRTKAVEIPNHHWPESYKAQMEDDRIKEAILHPESTLFTLAADGSPVHWKGEYHDARFAAYDPGLPLESFFVDDESDAQSSQDDSYTNSDSRRASQESTSTVSQDNLSVVSDYFVKNCPNISPAPLDSPGYEAHNDDDDDDEGLTPPMSLYCERIDGPPVPGLRLQLTVVLDQVKALAWTAVKPWAAGLLAGVGLFSWNLFRRDGVPDDASLAARFGVWRWFGY